MRTICLYFQIHQPFRLRRYRFFDIGNYHYYYDDYLNESILRKVADRSYLPANKLMLDLVKKYKGKFKLSFSISGAAMEQFEMYAPEVLESFKALAKTGHVEFLAETNAHSLVTLKDKDEFKRQVKMHSEKIKNHFGVTPKVFRNTELIYSDSIGEMVADLGFEAMLTEGAKHVLGWKSPNYLYNNANNPKLKLLLKNFKLSDDIAFRFSDQSWNEWPLTAEKFVGWLSALDPKEEIVNLFMDYETFGEHQWKETGIFDFLKAFPENVFATSNFNFGTPTEIVENYQPVSAIHVAHPISWADEERDLTAWLGNDLQEEAFNKLYDLSEKIKKTDDPALLKDWQNLQNSDHFYYMCTKFFSDGEVHAYFNPYNSPYDAFINYMNVLSDFALRLDAAVPQTTAEKKIANLSQVIKEREEQIKAYEEEIQKLKQKTKQKRSSTTSGGAKKPSVKSKTAVTAAKKASQSKTSAASLKAKAGGSTTKKAVKSKSAVKTRKK